MQSKCICCDEVFDGYYVRHFFIDGLCEPCWQDQEIEEEEDETP